MATIAVNEANRADFNAGSVSYNPGDTIEVTGNLLGQLVPPTSGTSGNIVTIDISGATFDTTALPAAAPIAMLALQNRSFITVDGGAPTVVYAGPDIGDVYGFNLTDSSDIVIQNVVMSGLSKAAFGDGGNMIRITIDGCTFTSVVGTPELAATDVQADLIVFGDAWDVTINNCYLHLAKSYNTINPSETQHCDVIQNFRSGRGTARLPRNWTVTNNIMKITGVPLALGYGNRAFIQFENVDGTYEISGNTFIGTEGSASGNTVIVQTGTPGFVCDFHHNTFYSLGGPNTRFGLTGPGTFTARDNLCFIGPLGPQTIWTPTPPSILTRNNNLYWGGADDDLEALETGGVNADPLLADPNNEDFTLLVGSPALGADSVGGDIGAWGAASGNQSPTADAGPDQNLRLPVGDSTMNATLDGSGSSDPDGTIATYTWTGTPDPTDVVGPTVSLGAGIHVFTLVVTDNEGADSTGDTVTITVVANAAPTADAGPDQNVTLSVGESTIDVTLDGSGSSDSDGTISTYTWTGSPNPDDVAGPTIALGVGTHVFTLVVTDNDGEDSTGDTVSIVVNEAANQSPTADAGPDQALQLALGASTLQATLDGSGSSDSDGTVDVYTWTGTPNPDDEVGPTVTLGVGTHVFTLVVTDNDGADSSQDTVTITVSEPNGDVLKYGSIRAAIVAFLRTSAALTSDTSHTTADPRIVGASKFDDLPNTGCFVFTRPTRPLLAELDDGPYLTSAHLYLRHTDEITLHTMIGTIHELVSETNAVDAVYDGHANVDITSVRWSPDHSNAPEVQKDPQGYWWSDVFLIARWIEKEAA